MSSAGILHAFTSPIKKIFSSSGNKGLVVHGEEPMTSGQIFQIGGLNPEHVEFWNREGQDIDTKFHVDSEFADPVLRTALREDYMYPHVWKVDKATKDSEVIELNGGKTWRQCLFPDEATQVEERQSNGQLVQLGSFSDSLSGLKPETMLSCPMALDQDVSDPDDPSQPTQKVWTLVQQHFQSPFPSGYHKIGQPRFMTVTFETEDESMTHSQFIERYKTQPSEFDASLGGAITLKVNRSQLQHAKLLVSDTKAVVVHHIERLYERNTTLVTLDANLVSKISDPRATSSSNKQPTGVRWDETRNVATYSSQGEGVPSLNHHLVRPQTQSCPAAHDRFVYIQDKKYCGADFTRFIRVDWTSVASQLLDATRRVSDDESYDILALELPSENDTQFRTFLSWFLVNYYLPLRYRTELLLKHPNEEAYRNSLNKHLGYNDPRFKHPKSLVHSDDLHKLIRVGEKNVIYFLGRVVRSLLSEIQDQYDQKKLLMKLDELTLTVRPAKGKQGWEEYERASRIAMSKAGVSPFAQFTTDIRICYIPFEAPESTQSVAHSLQMPLV